VPDQTGPDIEEDQMYPTMVQAVGADRIREWHEQAARDRLVSQARRARREAAPAAGLPRLRLGSRWPARRRAAAAVPDEQAAAAALPGERAGDRQPVGGRAA
jgi:hypothetical protein